MEQPQWYLDTKSKFEPDWYHCEAEGDLVRVWYREEIADYDIQTDWQDVIEKLIGVKNVHDIRYTPEELERDEFIRCLFVFVEDQAVISQVIELVNDTFEGIKSDLERANE